MYSATPRAAIGSFVLLAVSLSLSACGGSSGSSNRSDGGSEPQGSAPGLSFSAAQTTVSPGGTTTLSWSASNAASCEASGGWSGSRQTSGSEQVGPIQTDTDYRLSCSGSGGGVSREVSVMVDDGSGAKVSLNAEPPEVAAGSSTTLKWSSQNVTSCTASGGWSGSQAVSGSFDTGALSQTTQFQLSCSGPSGKALASVTVKVLDKVLHWQAPTQNVDGSALTDLAGFRVYWGSASRSYGTPVEIADPTATQWTATMAPGTYYFALTAFDGSNNESAYSNELLKTIPP